MVIYHVYFQEWCGGGVTEEYSHEYFLNKDTAERKKREYIEEVKKKNVRKIKIMLDEISVDES